MRLDPWAKATPITTKPHPSRYDVLGICKVLLWRQCHHITWEIRPGFPSDLSSKLQYKIRNRKPRFEARLARSSSPVALALGKAYECHVRRYIQLPTCSYTKNSPLTALVNSKVTMISCQDDNGSGYADGHLERSQLCGKLSLENCECQKDILLQPPTGNGLWGEQAS